MGAREVGAVMLRLGAACTGTWDCTAGRMMRWTVEPVPVFAVCWKSEKDQLRPAKVFVRKVRKTNYDQIRQKVR